MGGKPKRYSLSFPIWNEPLADFKGVARTTKALRDGIFGFKPSSAPTQVFGTESEPFPSSRPSPASECQIEV